jgi:hypothetical protein
VLGLEARTRSHDEQESSGDRSAVRTQDYFSLFQDLEVTSNGVVGHIEVFGELVDRELTPNGSNSNSC